MVGAKLRSWWKVASAATVSAGSMERPSRLWFLWCCSTEGMLGSCSMPGQTPASWLSPVFTCVQLGSRESVSELIATAGSELGHRFIRPLYQDQARNEKAQRPSRLGTWFRGEGKCFPENVTRDEMLLRATEFVRHGNPREYANREDEEAT